MPAPAPCCGRAPVRSTSSYLRGLSTKRALPYSRFGNVYGKLMVEIYTRDYCYYCHSAKELLNRKGVAFTEIDITGRPERRVEMVRRANGRSTVPQIFIGPTHVGGCDDLYALEAAGRLDALLQAGEETSA